MRIPKNLKTERLGNRLWRLLEDLTVIDGDTEYKVPKGFITDGASCPRPLWSLCSPMAGPFGEGAVLHDYLYSIKSTPIHPTVSRLDADKLLYKVGRYRGAGLLRSLSVKTGVNSAGWMFYKKPSKKMKGMY